MTQPLRIKNDYYPTDVNLFESLFEKCPFIDRNSLIFDPCAGDGRLTELCPNIKTNEPYPSQRFQPDYQMDACDRESWKQFDEIDWTITNPPYKGDLPDKIIQNAWEHSRLGIAFLMRLTYLEPCKKRRKLLAALKDHLRAICVINPRCQYLLKEGKVSTDNCTSVWLVCEKSWSWERQVGHCPLEFILDWKQ